MGLLFGGELKTTKTKGIDKYTFISLHVLRQYPRSPNARNMRSLTQAKLLDFEGIFRF